MSTDSMVVAVCVYVCEVRNRDRQDVTYWTVVRRYLAPLAGCPRARWGTQAVPPPMSPRYVSFGRRKKLTRGPTLTYFKSNSACRRLSALVSRVDCMRSRRAATSISHLELAPAPGFQLTGSSRCAGSDRGPRPHAS